MAVSKCPCLTLSNVMFRCQNLIGKSKYHIEEKVTPFTVMESTHSQSWQRLLATKYNIHPHLCMCVIVQVRSYPFSSTRNQKSKNHLDNNIITSCAMEGFALPDKDMVICFLVLFYNVFHLQKNTFKLLQAVKTFFLLRNPEIFLVYSVRLRFILQSALACEKLATFRITLQNLHYVWLSQHQIIKIIIFHLTGQHWFTWIRHMAIIKH